MQHTEKGIQAAQKWVDYYYANKFDQFDPDKELTTTDLEAAHLAGQAYAKENAWIRVDSGELPPLLSEHSQITIDVLFGVDGVAYKGYYNTVYRLWYSKDKREWFNSATHWQPLPTPPTE